MNLDDMDNQAITRKCTISLIASLAIVLIGTIFTVRLTLQSNEVDHKLFHLREDIQEQKEYLQGLNR
jgi:hypothetical protein